MKYRHKKTGKIATDVHSCEMYGIKKRINSACIIYDYIPKWVVEDSVDWEEIKPEPTYQILSFRSTKNPDSADCMLNFGLSVKTGNYEIYSVKRLSDGEVFTIGDEIEGTTISKSQSIKKFSTVDNEMYANQMHINSLFLKKKPILTTEDGVEKFEGDRVYFVRLDTKG